MTTVPELWREWTIGLGGLLSVVSLDASYGSRWRTTSERQYYSIRKVIIDEIVAIAGGQIGDHEAVAAVVEALEHQ